MRLAPYTTTALLCLHALLSFSNGQVVDPYEEMCVHQKYATVNAPYTMAEGEVKRSTLKGNFTDLFYYENFNVTTINQPDEYRKLIIQLEPCYGSVYLYVRKTRPCYPDPYTGTWTHFKSVTDGTQDGAPTYFEVPLSATKYYIAVYANNGDAQYTLTLLADIGAFPRPGGSGRLQATQISELDVQVSWTAADYIPIGVSQTRQYLIYSSLLLEADSRTNANVFLRQDKVMNTVCGLTHNTDKAYTTVPASACSADGKCTAIIKNVATKKKYLINVVAESQRDYRAAYGGILLRTDWSRQAQAASDTTLTIIGAVTGSIIGVIVIAYLWMLKLYA